MNWTRETSPPPLILMLGFTGRSSTASFSVIMWNIILVDILSIIIR